MTPATLPPIKPLKTHRKKLEAVLRKVWLRPAFAEIEKCLHETAVGIAQALQAVERPRQSTAFANPAKVAIQAHMRRVEAYHRERTRMTILRALGWDGRLVLSDAAIRPILEKAVAENVALIQELDATTRKSLACALLEVEKDKLFNRKSLDWIVRREMRTAGHRLKTITRDQTSKTIGRLTKARHEEVGIAEYIWATPDDGQVRPEHQALSGTRHRWDTPPSEGHPGEAVLCGCLAIPVLDTAKKITGKTNWPGRTHKAAAKTGTPATRRTRKPEPGELGKPPKQTDDERYPQMEECERIAENRYVTDTQKFWHMAIQDYFDAERDTMVKYFIGDGADEIREEMNRYGKLVSWPTKEMNRRIKQYATVGDKDRIVWRGMKVNQNFLKSLRIGTTLPINSPASTSTSIGVAKKFARGSKDNVMLRVHLPKKVKRLVTNPGDLEMTIPSGHRFRVVRVYTNPMDVVVAGERKRIEKWVDVVAERAK